MKGFAECHQALVANAVVYLKELRVVKFSFVRIEWGGRVVQTLKMKNLEIGVCHQGISKRFRAFSIEVVDCFSRVYREQYRTHFLARKAQTRKNQRLCRDEVVLKKVAKLSKLFSRESWLNAIISVCSLHIYRMILGEVCLGL